MQYTNLFRIIKYDERKEAPLVILLTQGYGQLSREWHVHESCPAGFCRVYYLTGGRTTYSDIEQTRLLDIGRLYVFPSHIPYSITHDEKNPLCCLWYHFDLFPASVDKLIELKPEGSLSLLLEALILEMTGNRAHSAYYTNLVQALESYILEHGTFSSPAPALLEILRAIRASYTDHSFSVDHLSATFGYSTEHFIRSFKRSMNITPYQYVTNLRMAEAVRLLMDGISVGKIAEAVGYSESKVFARAFTERYGISPSKYREYYYPDA